MLVNFFPLTVYKEKVGLDDKTRKLFASIIADQQKGTSKDPHSPNESWVGGMHGKLSLHLADEFQPLTQQYSKHLKAYMGQLGFAGDDLDVFITRSWGTYGLANESISQHRHTSSALSIAYYVSLPEGSASITFATEAHQNEPIRGLFREGLINGKIDPRNPLSAINASIEVEEDDMVIFPSHMMHGVRPGRQNAPRISIACDTVFLTKTVTNSEKILPPVTNWKNVSW
ncbi:MAG: putative 2OG-Fe(II) oxygenase [Pseudomonadota bacterium]